MVTPRARTTFAVFVTALVLQLNPARAAVPDYKLGDVAETDVVTPVPLLVINPEATEALKQKAAQEVRFVVRHSPQVVADAEAELRESIVTARRNFMTNLRPADLETPGFTRVIRAIARTSRKDLPFDKLAPLWTKGQGDEAVLESLLQPIREVMGQPIVNNKTDSPMPTNQPVRLVPVKDLNATPSLAELDQPGQQVPAGRVLSLWRARRLVEAYFTTGQEAMGRFAASFVRINAVPDAASTEVLRARRIEGLTVNDTYETAQVIVRQGQVIDRKALGALAAMREKSMIGTLQTKLEEEKTRLIQEQVVAGQIQAQTKWIAGSLGAVCVALVIILWRLRPRASTALVPIPAGNPALPGATPDALPSGEGDESWRSRALIAEGKAERAHQAIRSGVMGWMKEKVVRTLFRQRAELLDAQQKAEAEMRELEQRLEQLHAPLQERISAYEQRIEELEKDLAAKGEENRELIGARISVARQHLSMERERSRFGIN
jgi:hypothetical protein